MVASYKFLQKFWMLHQNIKYISEKNNNKDASSLDLNRFTNEIIQKVTHNLEKFHYNVIIANLYETYNFLIKFVKNPIDKNNLIKNYIEIFLKIMSPIVPHLQTNVLRI